jgi:flagellar basal body P-ring protein FlgI
MWDWGAKKQPTTRPAGTMAPEVTRQRPSVAMEGTIGSVTYLQGTRMMRVRGYGLVVGLGDKGSRNVRPSVRSEVLTELRRYRLAHPHETRDLPSAERQLDSLDTAVVEVTADIPAGAIKDQHFDVFVRADDEDTQSLVGGTLVPCDLRIYQESPLGQGTEGRIHAKAAGPIFTNPFISPPRTTTAPASQPATVNLREGTIIGGGINKLDRRLSLVTIVESYATVRAIQDSINRRFTREEKLADAVSPTNVELKIPPEYAGDRQRFLELVMHLPLASSPIQREARTKALIAEFGRGDAPFDDIALSLEGIGSTVIPTIQPLYTDDRRAVNYHAARAGLRLGDSLAIDVVIRHAMDTKGPYRLAAIRELGYCKETRAANALRYLLSDPDTRVRIRAYESLRKCDPDSISRFIVGDLPQNFLLEIVPSDGPPLIYARRTEGRRIALISGERMLFRPPLLYAQPGQPVTLSAGEGARFLTLLRKGVSGSNVGPFDIPLTAGAVPVIRFMGANLRLGPRGRLDGLGLDYAVVLDVLFRLCDKDALNADMRWEGPSVEDLVGPLEPMGRPESEL